MTINKHNPKVFISYCQENIEFSDKVLAFSDRLRREGIDTILDQYEESPEEGWPRWMENSINNSEFVIVICTEEYLNRLMMKTEYGVGKGVKWESNIIYQHLYNDETLSKRFIPVVFSHKDTKFIPLPLKGISYYNVTDKKRYDQLYWRLRGVTKSNKPELGELRPLEDKERKSLFISTPIDIEAWDKAIWRGAAFLIDPKGAKIPIFLLPFKNEKYASKIFNGWRSLFGAKDENNEIRIAVVEGEIPGTEKGYSIHITPNIDKVIERMIKIGIEPEEGMIMSISRVQRANPTDNFEMYNLFKKQYLSRGEFLLAPAIVNEKEDAIKPLIDLGIVKEDLIFKNVTDIDKNDVDYPIFGHMNMS